MAWQPTTGLQISGHRFLRRRLECALLGRDPRTVNESLRGPAHSLAAGAAVSVVLLAGCLVLALLRPQPDAETAPIVMERQSGALYVRLGDTLHPVLNLASARLILGTDADPRPMAASAFRYPRLGPPLGIPGAPQALGKPLDESSWTVCDGRDGTTVIVGGQRRSDALNRDQGLLVTPSSGGSTYLMFDGRRAMFDPGDAAVARALGLDGLRPFPVSSVLLNLIPEAPPIVAPRIPDSGGRGPETLPGFTVGSVLRVARSEGDEYYVVLRHGIQRVGRVAAELMRYADSQDTRTTISVAPDVIRATKSVMSLPVFDLPDKTRALPIADGATLCVTWDFTSGGATVSFSIGAPTFPAGQEPVRLVQGDGPGPAVDAVYLSPGRLAYARATSLSGANVRAGTRYLVSDTGVRFAVHDDAAAHDLGLPDTAPAAPWSVLAALPAGPELSRVNASVARDVSSP
ncbi:type VII secretion protein EccB [Candidatus Mycobacterium wuenschmannii]|uniref:Type VII secretion protein EccB n=1 Tax=Candidatus Mycobacterium wuenschmannii TaxID=3027808 RepID=A0ABY8VVF1_9MYCO|nr:type VII secretion protein EccB [Candidatus Mycobacterium wuenschmannii]WIM87633.1 type VII secretion protein EccB [Candidatus Mycobacterium wuenschmannii]